MFYEEYIKYIFSDRDERYSFSLISDMRKKLSELREKYSGVDWSGFTEEI